MKIKKLLELHHKSKVPSALSKNFGDGFLLQNNRIYKNIRLAAIKNKFKFTDDFNPQYQSLPLGQLETILKNKAIPYTDNVTALENLVEQLKDSVSIEEVSDGFKRNYVFHEACHAVIRSASNFKEDLKSLSGQRERCFQILLEESFSNACELLAVIDVQDQAHRVFFEMNSYTFLFENRTHLKKAMDEIGEDVTFKFFVVTYLYSNFLHNGLSTEQLNKIIKLFTKNSVDIKTLKALSKIPFTLDLNFRVVTTSLHLKISGLDRKPQELLDFDFLDFFLKDKKYLALLDVVTKIALSS